MSSSILTDIQLLTFLQKVGPNAPQDLPRSIKGARLELVGDEKTKFTNAKGSDINIINARNSMVPESIVYTHLTHDEYRQMQQYGCTINLDQALTAKIIGTIGQYRLNLLIDQEKYGIISHHRDDKLAICDNLTDRVQALQMIERAYGRTKAEVLSAIAAYKLELQRLIALKESTSHQSHPFIAEVHLQGLKDDLVYAEELLITTQKMPQELQHPLAYKSGYDETKHPIAKFLRHRINKIVSVSKECNSYITLTDGRSLFNGELQEFLVMADKLNAAHYKFPINKLFTPEDQGDYSSYKDQKITLISNYAVGEDKTALQRFILAANYTLFAAEAPFEKDTAPLQAGAIRSWKRVFKSERTDSCDIKRYHELVDKTAKADISSAALALEDIKWFFSGLLEGLMQACNGIMSAILSAGYKIYTDFNEPFDIESEIRSQIESSMPEENVVSETTAELAFSYKWHHVYTPLEKMKITIDLFVKGLKLRGISISSHEDKAIQEFIKAYEHSKQTDREDNAPLAVPPNQLLDDTEASDGLSRLVSGIIAAYNIFDIRNEISPTISFIAILGDFLTGMAIVQPEFIRALGTALNINVEPFISACAVAGHAMADGEVAQFIATGSTTYQALMLVLEGISAGPDSVGGKLLHLFSDHYLFVIAIAALSIQLGYSLAHLVEIPGISEELRMHEGQSPLVAELFTGMKIGFVLYESLHSKPQERSVLGGIIATVFDLAVLPIRLAFSFANLVWNPKRFLIPWIEAVHKLTTLLLIVIDAALRLVHLACRIVKQVAKTTFDAFLTVSANLAKYLLIPFISPANNIVAIGIMRAKFRVFDFFDSITRPLNEKFNGIRFFILSYLLRDHSHLHNLYKGWFKLWKQKSHNSDKKEEVALQDQSSAFRATYTKLSDDLVESYSDGEDKYYQATNTSKTSFGSDSKPLTRSASSPCLYTEASESMEKTKQTEVLTPFQLPVTTARVSAQ